ncbi:hypothetical protein Cal6303_4539 [Calothrix sp. PCC 6303]|nr:hypothetical protein Cal6303_4539 [Calothrix sp. PCC 6303]
MNTIFSRHHLIGLLSLMSIGVLSGTGFPAVAQTSNSQTYQSTTAVDEVGQPLQNAKASDLSNLGAVNSEISSVSNTTPVPGTAVTSSSGLKSTSSSQQLAQSDISVGRANRGGSSYVGIAGNIGVGGGDSSLGDGNFAVISKIGLSRTLSVRPAAVVGDNTTFLLPVTYDFNLQSATDPFVEPLPIAPYVGVGAAIKTGGDDSTVAFLVSGGVDVPLNRQFTATASVNAGFFDQTDVGFLIGVGYNFSGF